MNTPPEILIKKAMEARQNAYAPYSSFRVGAALLCKDGLCLLKYLGVGCDICSDLNGYGIACINK